MYLPNLKINPVPGASQNLNRLSISSQSAEMPAMTSTGEVRIRMMIPKNSAVYSRMINLVLEIPENGIPLNV